MDLAFFGIIVNPLLLLFYVLSYCQRCVALTLKWFRGRVVWSLRKLIQSLSLYGELLRLPVLLCRRMGLVGDILLIPITVAWTCWPLYVGW